MSAAFHGEFMNETENVDRLYLIMLMNSLIMCILNLCKKSLIRDTCGFCGQRRVIDKNSRTPFLNFGFFCDWLEGLGEVTGVRGEFGRVKMFTDRQNFLQIIRIWSKQPQMFNKTSHKLQTLPNFLPLFHHFQNFPLQKLKRLMTPKSTHRLLETVSICQ